MRVLFLTHRLPYAPNRGDRIRSYYLLREMSRFAEVSVFSFIHDDEEAAHVSNVPFAHDVSAVRVTRFRNLVRSAAGLASHVPLTHSLLDAPATVATLARQVESHPPDVVVAFCSGMARFAFKAPLLDRRLVIDLVDVDSAKWTQLANHAHGPRRWIYHREASTLGEFERSAVSRAEITLVVNDRERQTLVALAPNARVAVVENGIDVESFAPSGPPAAAPVVIFCGVMNYYPNEEGVRWFAGEVWPRVVAERPDARFLIVGAHPTSAVRRLAVTDPSIEVVGPVERVQPHLWRSAVSVAPLRLARGLQNKVLEALAAALPVVVTPAVSDGLPPEARPGCLVAERPDEFAGAVLSLLRATPDERRIRAGSARLQALSWSERLRRLEDILRGTSTPVEASA